MPQDEIGGKRFGKERMDPHIHPSDEEKTLSELARMTSETEIVEPGTSTSNKNCANEDSSKSEAVNGPSNQNNDGNIDIVVLDLEPEVKQVDLVTLGDSDYEDDMCCVVFEKVARRQTSVAGPSRTQNVPNHQTKQTVPPHLKTFHVLVSNLPRGIQMGHIEAYFAGKFIPIKAVSLHLDDDGVPNGTANLQVTGYESYTRALSLDGCSFMGQHIDVKRKRYFKRKSNFKEAKQNIKCESKVKKVKVESNPT